MFAIASPVVTARQARMQPAKGRRACVIVRANEKQGKGGEEGGVKFDNSCYGMIGKNANFGLLGAAIKKAGLDTVLMGAGPFTVFAPNDDAFADAAKALKLTKVELMALPNLPDILKYHVVAGAVTSSQLTEGQEVVTVLGKKLKVTLAGGVKINGVPVKKADIKVSNGILHSVSGVLLPPA